MFDKKFEEEVVTEEEVVIETAKAVDYEAIATFLEAQVVEMIPYLPPKARIAKEREVKEFLAKAK